MKIGGTGRTDIHTHGQTDGQTAGAAVNAVPREGHIIKFIAKSESRLTLEQSVAAAMRDRCIVAERFQTEAEHFRQ